MSALTHGLEGLLLHGRVHAGSVRRGALLTHLKLVAVHGGTDAAHRLHLRRHVVAHHHLVSRVGRRLATQHSSHAAARLVH